MIQEVSNMDIVDTLRGMIAKYNVSDKEWQAIEQAIRIVNEARFRGWNVNGEICKCENGKLKIMPFQW